MAGSTGVTKKYKPSGFLPASASQVAIALLSVPIVHCGSPGGMWTGTAESAASSVTGGRCCGDWGSPLTAPLLKYPANPYAQSRTQSQSEKTGDFLNGPRGSFFALRSPVLMRIHAIRLVDAARVPLQICIWNLAPARVGSYPSITVHWNRRLGSTQGTAIGAQ